MDLTEAIVDKDNEPVLYPLVYSSSSFSTKDLPMVFGYSMTQCVPFYTKFSSTLLKKLTNNDSEDNMDTNNFLTEQAHQLRLDIVDKILCSAYVNDLSCQEYFTSLVPYFIHTYSIDQKINYIQTNFSSFKNYKKMILTEEDFIKGISILSTSEFDSFLKHFSQFLNLQISNDINQVLQFCGFYLKSWESLD